MNEPEMLRARVSELERSGKNLRDDLKYAENLIDHMYDLVSDGDVKEVFRILCAWTDGDRDG